MAWPGHPPVTLLAQQVSRSQQQKAWGRASTLPCAGRHIYQAKTYHGVDAVLSERGTDSADPGIWRLIWRLLHTGTPVDDLTPSSAALAWPQAFPCPYPLASSAFDSMQTVSPPGRLYDITAVVPPPCEHNDGDGPRFPGLLSERGRRLVVSAPSACCLCDIRAGLAWAGLECLPHQPNSRDCTV